MKVVKDKWVGMCILLLVVAILLAATFFLPWWSVSTSPEVSAILNSNIRAEYYLPQTVTATKTINNETQVISVSFTNLTENQESLRELSLWFSVAYVITVLGLGFSCLLLIMVILAKSGRFFHKYMILVGYIAAIMLLSAPIILMLNFSTSISNLSKLVPVDIPLTWAPLTPKDIKSFWGAIDIKKSFNLPEWTVGGNFWIWGGDAGWYFTFAASLIMFFAVWVIRKMAKREVTESHLSLREKPTRASSLAMAGGILMFINGVLVGINKAPLILSTSAVSSPTEIVSSNSPFWGRLAFGTRGWVEGYWTLVWLMLALIVIYCSARLYIEPIRRKVLGLLIVLLAILSIPCGGGFIIGSILAVIGGAIGFQWPTPSKETLFGKMVQVAKLDGTLYGNLKENPDSLTHGVYILFIASILSGLGCGFYSSFTEKIVNDQSLNVPFRILMLGEAPLDVSVLSPAIIGIGITMLKWFVLSSILYLVSVLSLRNKISLEKIGAAVGFTYVPISLQFFMPLLLTSKPYITFIWPFALILLTNLWMALALILGIKQMLEISWNKALGIVSLSGAFYLWIDQKFFITLDIPYNVRFLIQPESVLLLMLACLVALAVLLFGIFKQR